MEEFKRRVALVADSLTEGRPGVSFSNVIMEKYPCMNAY